MELIPFLPQQKEIWEIAKVSREEIKQVAEKHKLTPLLARLIISRGLNKDENELKKFLNPPKSLIHQFDQVTDKTELEKATSRLVKALKKKEAIMINGDPDADGITGATILVAGLRHFGAKVYFDFPVRAIEGHGLQPRIIELAKKKKANVLITADCGTKNNETIDYANTLGIDVIVSDHHIIGKHLPNAYAMINPYTVKGPTAFKKLSGAAVAYKLILALFHAMKQEIPKKLDQFLLALAALGTISDRMSILDPMNRAMVSKGIAALNNTQMEGLKALILVSADHLSEIKANDVSRTISPRLNAPGRIGNPFEGIPDSRLVVDLLLIGSGEQNAQRAETLLERFKEVIFLEQIIKNPDPEGVDPSETAGMVDDVNEKRKQITSKIEDEIELLIKQQVNAQEDRIIIIQGKDWNSGVIGIDADRLKERFLRPAMILNEETQSGYLRGSIRSIPSIDMYDIIEQVQDDYESATGKNIFEIEVDTQSGKRKVVAFGGHAQACGFSITKEKVPELIRRVREKMQQLSNESFIYAHEILDTIDISEINTNLLDVLDKLSPYGQCFDYPIFQLKNCEIGNKVRPFGNKYQKSRTPHIDFTVDYRIKKTNVVERLNAVGFGLWDKFQTILAENPGTKFELIFFPEKVVRMGKKKKRSKLRLNVLDIKPSK